MIALILQTADATPMMEGIPWIDKVGIVLLAIFGILGFWRGLWWQVIRLIGFVGAFAAARFFSPKAEPMLTEAFNITDPRFSQGLAWLVIFIAALIVVVLLGKLGKSMLDAMKLGLVDRLGGALAGAVTAILIHSAFLAVMSLFAQADWLNEQLVGSWSDGLFVRLAEYPVIVDKKQSVWIGTELRSSGFNLPAMPAVH
jgi:membrane protein required for colicin V production